ncbi:hypothetical protein AOA12_10585 [Microbacterium sp. No. 7]|nr:hypothetical protein AOA12_10585 [Microbacterium sp. No. 7]
MRSSVKGAVRSLGRAARSERLAFLRSRPLRPHVVFYESFAGNGVLCNPEAIFRGLLADPDLAHLEHVWAIADPAARNAFVAEFVGHPRVRCVERLSDDYWRELSTAGTVVNNATFPAQFGKREGQVYLNTWHGTPLKHMGFDMPDGAADSANTLRNLLMADYLLAANPFMAETMYEDAYRLRNVYRGTLIETGYPRIDHQFHGDGSDVRARLAAAGVAVGSLPVVLFAPTWRGSTFAAPDDDLDHLGEQVAAMQEAVGPDAIVLLKTHQVVHAAAVGHPRLRDVLVPNTIPTNALLGAAAALVTDYSSIFFDYLASRRPIVFFTPDADEYARDRGTYFAPDELPGPVTGAAGEAGAHVRRLLADGPSERVSAWSARFTPWDDGHATQRVIDVVFRGGADGTRRVRRDDRTRILLHAGGMRSNGITTSLVNLLRALDPERYDVTLLLQMQRTPAAVMNRARVPATVRQVFRIGGMNGSKALQARRRLSNVRGRVHAPRHSRSQDRLWRDEWDRIFGSAEFDWVADFSGYGHFWPSLLLRSPDAPRAIWLHNEMASDRLRTIDGRAPMKRSLGLVFEQYGSFDRLVSVSPSLTRLNREELSEYAPPDRFVTVRNVPDMERVALGAQEPPESVLDEDEPAPAWLTSLAAPRRDERWFVTVARLSPEKNQARLVRAFAGVHERDARARLLIVGGGPLRRALQAQIDAAGLGDVAFLAGERRNPFALMAAADCFVMSSAYEGQPMVLLEAAVCGLPIVSTAFASVGDALPGDTIRVVAQDDDALRDGMLAYLAGEVPASALDIPAYMAEVTAEFDAVVAESLAERR